MTRRDAPETRRDFLGIAAWGMGLTAVGAGLWTVLGATIAPDEADADSVRVDLSWIGAGEQEVFSLEGKPVTVWRRTLEQAAQARDLEMASLRDPLARNANLDPKALAQDDNRRSDDVIVVWSMCTRKGCVLRAESGDFGGWFCPCCASHYDLSGWVRKGPAPQNLAIPRYTVAGDILTIYPDGAGPVSDDQLNRLMRG